MLKHWRVLLLLVTLIGAMLAIGLKAYPYGRNGVEIIYIGDDSPARGILEEKMIITEINSKKVKDFEAWKEIIKNLKGEVKVIANGKEYKFFVNKTLGIDAFDIEKTNLDFGLDIRGGTRVILKPKENITKDTVDQVIATLKTRSNIYGLKELKFYPVSAIDGYYIQIEAAGVGSDVVNDLLSKQGNFEAKIIKPVKLVKNTGLLKLGEKSYTIIAENETIKIDNKIISLNGSFNLSGIKFKYLNKTGSKVALLADVYKGKDIELVYTDPQHSGLMPNGNVWKFYFGILVSSNGAEKFSKVTSGIPKYIDIQSGEEYLDSQIILYIDNKVVSDLRISADLAGRIVNTVSIQGSRAEREDALEEKLKLQTILRSGALPTTLETVSTDTISPALGSNFLNSAGIAAVFAAIIIVVIVFIRYRKIKIAVPMVFVSLSEVVIILGIAATNDSLIWGSVLVINFCLVAVAWWQKQEIDIYAWVGALLIPLLGMMSWTIDLPAIGGIIAALGTGVDHQIIIADETTKGKEKIYNIKEKIRRAFFIIFGAASTTIAAMLPLMFLGIGLVRGFAITTIVGVLVGILITRPAYAKIIESVRG